MCAHQLKKDIERCRYEYENCKANFNVAFSEEAKQAFLANPKSVWFQNGSQTREESLTEEWNDEKRRHSVSLERKAKRLDMAEMEYARECWFQSNHAYVDTVIDDKVLCGYYRVFRVCSSANGQPMHYEFVLKRHSTGDEIPSKVIVPLSTVMGTVPCVPTANPFWDVSPSKITLREEAAVTEVAKDNGDVCSS
jgi:hypothetical protein